MDAATTNAFAIAAMQILSYAEGYLDGPGHASLPDVRAAAEDRKIIRRIVHRELGAELFQEFDKDWKRRRLSMRRNMLREPSRSPLPGQDTATSKAGE
tara:strand:- start:79 stop:372 length:294 start_codon:yes stop_codon:yes gene_type:complete